MKSDTQHWTMQRVSAILLIPLSYWLLAFLQLCLNADYFEITEWLSSFINKMGLMSWVIVVCYHASIGVQVVLEDYISNQSKQLTAIWSVHSFFVILVLSSIAFLF